MPRESKEYVKKSNAIKLVEYKFGGDIIEILKTDYTDNKMTITQMAEKYDVSVSSVHKWLMRFDIPRRHLTFL